MAATAVPLLPFDQVAAGTLQVFTPVNLNALRSEVIARPALSFEATQPVSPNDEDLHVLSAAWGDEVAGTLAYYSEGSWYYFVPFVGQFKRIGDVQYYTYDPDSSAEWQEFTAPTSVQVQTESGTSRLLLATDVGTYIRFTNSAAKTATVQDNADEAIAVGSEIHGRNVGTADLTLVEDTAVTINAPASGTLVIPQNGTFTLKKVATDEWDLFGVTVAA